MTPAELKTVLDAHALWLRGDPAGKRANLTGANLSEANLTGANLSEANLSEANLSEANLTDTSLRYTNLRHANLRHANLRHANLTGANLFDANLTGANLTDTSLRYTSLRHANLSEANLRYTSLTGANLSDAKNLNPLTAARLSITPEGRLIGWKKCLGGVIVKLAVPEEARRSNATGRKCRAEWAEVLEVHGGDVGVSLHDETTEYRVGQTVRCHKWCEDRWAECGGGIHFYLTREEAEAH